MVRFSQKKRVKVVEVPEMEWKNTPDLYNDYVKLEECPWAMQQILTANNWFFDDQFFYWIPAYRHGKKSNIVKRRPLYWYPQKSTPAEKVHRFIKGKQSKQRYSNT